MFTPTFFLLSVSLCLFRFLESTLLQSTIKVYPNTQQLYSWLLLSMHQSSALISLLGKKNKNKVK